nr:HAMP domain-containing sensor histidine kinase [Caenimonas aquaedulcis]
MLGVLFFVPQDPLTLALVVILVAAILSAALNSLGPYWPAHLAFALPCALPFAIECVTSGVPSLAVLGILAFFYLVFAETYARSIARSIERSLRLRFENLDLLREVTLSKQRADAANLAKTRLLAVVSHDLRQPLHGLGLAAGTVEAALREGLTGDPREVSDIAEIVRRMRQECEGMEQLVNQLLGTARLEEGRIQANPQRCDVSELLRTITAGAGQQARNKGLELRLFARGAHWVWTDPVLLHSIVSNLVSNAVKYTSSGGVLVACRRGRGSLRIEVWDTGIGIPADELELIMGDYYRARNANEEDGASRGFGLGLSIVSRLVAVLGLKFEVASRLGRGSRFVVELPGAGAAGPVTKRE